MRRSVHDLTFSALRQELVTSGINPFHTLKLWSALHREAATTVEDRSDFVPPVQRWISENIGSRNGGRRFFHEVPEMTADVASSDGLTRKFLLRLHDGQTVETVLMGYPGRFTACLSTQAGCAMGCVFCATGQMGFVRHLEPGEIVGQVLHVQRALRAAGHSGLRNLVLMGMGEPLHNYDSVMTALDIISDTAGINLGPSRISVSTVGIVPGILRMAEEKRPYLLAVSLHGATEEDRAALVPVSRRWPLSELIAACRVYGEKTRQRILFGWTLIAGVNDTPEHAGRIAVLLKGIDAHINLIPLNPTGGFAGSTTPDQAATTFKNLLQAAGFPSTIRQRRGIDVSAGCGQLKSARAAR